METVPCVVKTLSDADYFKNSAFVSYSSIKMFSNCETLYRDIHIDKTYEQPDKDYFIYGSLVDAMVTEGPKNVAENFIRVDRKVDTDDVLKFENKIKNLEEEISGKKKEMEEKKAKNEGVVLAKIATLKTRIKEAQEGESDTTKLMEKFAKLNDKLIEVSKKSEPMLEKGIASREKEVEEIKTSLGQISELANKQQVTGSIWDNAEETALALKTHPYFAQMEFDSSTSQQIFACEIDGIPRKGKLDHLKLSPAMTKIYSVWIAKQLSDEDFYVQVDALADSDRWAIITDIKTCFSIEKLEPYNKHYRGQLRFYQDLVHHVLRIPIDKIRCQIFVADKTSNSFKMAELFVYTQTVLDDLWPDTLAWIQIWKNAVDTNTYVSAKERNGMGQKCFTCTECRFCPFSAKPGEAVVVSGPRFND